MIKQGHSFKFRKLKAFLPSAFACLKPDNSGTLRSSTLILKNFMQRLRVILMLEAKLKIAKTAKSRGYH